VSVSAITPKRSGTTGCCSSLAGTDRPASGPASRFPEADFLAVESVMVNCHDLVRTLDFGAVLREASSDNRNDHRCNSLEMFSLANAGGSHNDNQVPTLPQVRQPGFDLGGPTSSLCWLGLPL